MAPAFAMLTNAAVANIVGLWFTKKRGLAMSVALTGGGVGGMVIVPTLVWLSSLTVVSDRAGGHCGGNYSRPVNRDCDLHPHSHLGRSEDCRAWRRPRSENADPDAAASVGLSQKG